MPVGSLCVPLAMGCIFLRAQPHVKTCASHESLYSVSLLPRIVWMHTKLIFSSCQSPQVAVKLELLQKNRRMPPGTWNTTCESIVSRTTLHWGWRSGTAVCPGFDQELLRPKTRISVTCHIQHFIPRLAHEPSKHGFTLRTSICCSLLVLVTYAQESWVNFTQQNLYPSISVILKKMYWSHATRKPKDGA